MTSLSHKVKRRSRLLSQLFQSYRPYDDKLGERQGVLVTEESHDGVHYVAHNSFYEQVCVRPTMKPQVTLETSSSLSRLFSQDKTTIYL